MNGPEKNAGIRIMVPLKTMEALTTELWYSPKYRKQQIKALMRSSTAGWPKKHVAHWRDGVEIGWWESFSEIYESQMAQAGYMSFPNADTLSRGTSIRDLQVKSAGVVGSTVGRVLALEYAQRGSDLPIHDPDWLALECKRILDDGRRVLESQQSDPILQHLWGATANLIEEKAGITLNLGSGLSRFSPA